MEQTELQRAIEAILFAAGERVEVSRLAMALEADPKEIVAATDAIMDNLSFERRGIRILKLDNGYQMVSSGEMADYVTKALETRKPPKLSASQLETLTIVAYYQPATKAMVEQIRGVDSAYSVSALLNKKLIEDALNILEDEWETESGIYVEPKAEITEDGKLVFTFCFDYSDYATDYTRVVATYTPKN